MRTELGKIEAVHFGHGGYQGSQLGLFLNLGGKGWGVGAGDDKCLWAPALIQWSENAKWSEADRDKEMAALCRYVSNLLKTACVDTVDQLRGKPVECTFDGNRLESWRILAEVL